MIIWAFIYADFKNDALVNNIVTEGMGIASKACTNEKTIKKAHFEEFRVWIEKYFALDSIVEQISSHFKNPSQEFKTSVREYLVCYFASPNYLRHFCDNTFEPEKTKSGRVPGTVITLFKSKSENKELYVIWSLKGGKIIEVEIKVNGLGQGGIKIVYQHNKIAQDMRAKYSEYAKKIKSIIEKNKAQMK